MQTSEQQLTDLLPESIGEWKPLEEDKFFNSENLYNYINGGAELYLSYGFNLVLKRIYAAPDQPEITVDIFEMTSSKNAFGVYSHSRETIDDKYGQGSFQVEGAILFWKDNYFISIIVFPETEKSKTAMEKLAEFIDKAIESEGEKPALLDALPENNLVEESVIYFRHHHWQNSYYFFSNENILNITDSTECLMAKYQYNKNRPILFLLKYKSEDEAATAHKNFTDNYFTHKLSDETTVHLDDNTWMGSKRLNECVVITFNSPDEVITEDLLNSALNKVKTYSSK